MSVEKTKAALLCLSLIMAMILSYFYLDRPLALFFWDYAAASPDAVQVFRNITELGRSHFYLVPSGVLALIALAMLRFGAFHKIEKNLKNLAAQAGFLFLCMGSAGLTINFLKILLGRARPKLLQAADQYGFLGWQFNADLWSFPSGHANTVIVLALALSLFFPRYRILFFVYGILIALSRVIVNAHYFSDILAGGLVAIVFFFLWRLIFIKRGWLPAKPAPLQN